MRMWSHHPLSHNEHKMTCGTKTGRFCLFASLFVCAVVLGGGHCCSCGGGVCMYEVTSWWLGVWVCSCIPTWAVTASEQISKDLHLISCGSQGSNSGPPVWEQMPFLMALYNVFII